MIIRFLDLLSDFLIRFFEGLVRYLGRLVPAAWRSLVLASPLFCLIWLAYIFVGERVALLFSILAVLMFIGGAVWAGKRRQVGEASLSLPVVIAVLALDILAIGFGILGMYLRSKELKEPSATTNTYLSPAPPIDEIIKPERSEKATVFVSAVSRSLDVDGGDYRDFDVRLLNHSLKEIRTMSAIEEIEVSDVINTLRYCQRSDLGQSRQEACTVVAPILIQVAADSQLEAYCKVLYEIQAEGRSFEAEARAATKNLCGE